MAQTVLAKNDSVLAVSSTDTTIVNDNTAQPIFTYSVKGGMLGTNNMLDIYVPVEWLNNTGSNASVTYVVTYGATTMIASSPTGTMSTSVTGRGGFIRLILKGDGATNAQSCIITHSIGTQVSPAVAGHYGTAAEDSTADKTLTITATLSSANNSLSITASGYIIKFIDV